MTHDEIIAHIEAERAYMEQCRAAHDRAWARWQELRLAEDDEAMTNNWRRVERCRRRIEDLEAML